MNSTYTPFQRFQRSLLAAFLLTCPCPLSAQQVLSNMGGSFSTASYSGQHTVGEAIVGTNYGTSFQLTQGFEQPQDEIVKLDLKVFLEGPLQEFIGLMDDDLRATHVPLTEPYTALGYTHIHGGDENISPTVLTVTGGSAVVDWIFVELLDKANSSLVLATRSALVLRNGNVVDVDGTSAVSYNVPADDYFIAVRHRNHLAVMTLNTYAMNGSPITVDLTLGLTPTYGIDAQKNMSGFYAMWAGDLLPDGTIKYTGANNDRDPILAEIGGLVPTSTTTGYLLEDANMDGVVKYTGGDNDRDLILTNIGGTVPTNTRTEQLP